MPHWSDEYPHDLHATVILKDNKIKLWKVGDGKLNQKYDIDRTIQEHPEYSYQEKTWSVNSDAEHNDVFNIHAPGWFRQWKMHEKAHGGTPWDDSFTQAELDQVFGGRYSFVKALKAGC